MPTSHTRALVLQEPDRKAAFELFAELEFKSLMREFLEAPEAPPPKAHWLTGSDAAQFLCRLREQSAVTLCFGFSPAPQSRRSAEIACIQGEAGDAALLDLRDREVARGLEGLLSTPGQEKVCWDAKLCELALGSRGIKVGSLLNDMMLAAFLISPHIGDYSLRRWALDQLHVSLPDEKAISSGNSTYANANFGHFATSLRCLSDPVNGCPFPWPPGTAPFLDEQVGLDLQTKHGYVRTYLAGAAGAGRPDPGTATYSYTADPVVAGQTGTRFFSVDQTGLICMSVMNPVGATATGNPTGCIPI